MTLKKTLTALVVLTLPLAAGAHRSWFLPAATVLSGEDPWVTVDATRSNDIFYFNHNRLGLDNLEVTAPDGESHEVLNAHTGQHRSVFDLHLTKDGTYKIAIADDGLRARWETEDGERRRWPGRGGDPEPGDFEKQVPQDANKLQVSHSSYRVETFLTAGAPTDGVLSLSGEGLELKPLTHPNDLFTGESARFQFFIDGEPAAGASVTLIKDGMRHRDSQAAIKLEANDDGIVTVDWKKPGMYWLEAEYEDDQAEAPATERRGTYMATLEVLAL